MMRSAVLAFLFIASLISCQQKHTSSNPSTVMHNTANNAKTELTCKLMPEALRQRKETVLNSLKAKVIERKELSNGYAFRFKGTDDVIDELVEFIKSERECCDFFVFNLSISGDKSEAWLEMTGVEGSKDFITEELGL